jgi:uridine kinase
LIGIAGPSCAGKTELARRLAETLKAPVVNLDSYYRSLGHLPPAERAKTNFDVPGSLDAELLAHHLEMMSLGHEVSIPVYDFAQHTRSDKVRILSPAPRIIIEGLFTLHWEEVRRRLAVKIYIGASSRACLSRRIERDVRERGRTPESVLRQYRTTVEPMARLYIVPTSVHADLVLDGENPLDESAALALTLIRKRENQSRERPRNPA